VAKPPSARAWCRPSTTWRPHHGLALTTYHYYTPSGRLIQRNYSGVSLYDYYYNHGGAQPADTANREVKLTDAGRTVYGGGGITPDEKIEAPRATTSRIRCCIRMSSFTSPRSIWPTARGQELPGGRAVLAEFKKYLTSQEIPWTEADLNGVMDWLKISIKDKIFTIQFGELQGCAPAPTGTRRFRRRSPICPKPRLSKTRPQGAGREGHGKERSEING
jgi:hypothetical protein